MWQLDNSLPNEFKHKDNNEKYSYLIEKFKTNNPLYLKIKNDLNLLITRKIPINELQSLDLDPRYFESLGLKETQIDDYYRFVDEIKAI